MATPTGALKQVRRARREVAPPVTQNYETFRPKYQEILKEMKDLGGDPALEELRDWMVERTKQSKNLPSPDAVRKQGRQICSKRGISIPTRSPLRSSVGS